MVPKKNEVGARGPMLGTRLILSQVYCANLHVSP